MGAGHPQQNPSAQRFYDDAPLYLGMDIFDSSNNLHRTDS